MPEEVTIVRGGITVVRERSGNLVIRARGNGAAHVQRADISDLIAAVAEAQRTDADGVVSETKREITGVHRRVVVEPEPEEK